MLPVVLVLIVMFLVLLAFRVLRGWWSRMTGGRKGSD